MSWDSLDISILGPAFLAGLLVLSTHVPLGRQVLAKGIIFIDLAIAQMAGLGVIAAHSFDWEPGGWKMQLTAAVAAMGGSLLLYVMERRWPQIQEALIGVVFVSGASIGILLVSANPHGGEAIKDLMAGQILWVSYSQLIPVAVLYALILASWGYRHRLSTLGFYMVFALAVTASVQLVGVYLVFASLIVPALAVRQLPAKLALTVGYGLGAMAYALGLALSALFDLPSGPVVVCALVVCALLAAQLFPRQASANAAI
jgi:zinc/manganese transport system permease protein